MRKRSRAMTMLPAMSSPSDARMLNAALTDGADTNFSAHRANNPAADSAAATDANDIIRSNKSESERFILSIPL